MVCLYKRTKKLWPGHEYAQTDGQNVRLMPFFLKGGNDVNKIDVKYYKMIIKMLKIVRSDIIC